MQQFLDYFLIRSDSPTGARAASFLRFLDHSNTPQLVGLPLTKDRLVAETSTSKETDVHVSGGIILLSFSLLVLYSYLVLCLDCPALCPLSLLYDTHNKNIHTPAEFEPAILASERPQTLAFDRWSTGDFSDDMTKVYQY